jgi:hypothetical protein
MPGSLREAWPVRTAMLALLAFTSVGCGSDAHGLSRLEGEEREVGEAVVEYYEAFARGDEEAFCDRVYAHEPGSDPWIPPAGSECYRQTLQADTAAADVIVGDVVVKGTTARVRLTAPRAESSPASRSVHLRRLDGEWRVRFITR